MAARGLLAAAACLALAAGCLQSPRDEGGATPTPTVTTPTPISKADPTFFNDSFERDAGWVVRAEAPAGVASNVTYAREHARSGAQSARFAIDGLQDDGTVWIERAFDITPGHAYDVNVTAWAWSDGASFNTLGKLVLYAGTTAPTGEGSFQLTDALDQQYGWRASALDVRSPVMLGARLYVAVGITVAWETALQYDIDDVSVAIVPV